MDLVRRELGHRCQMHIGNACRSQDCVDVKSFKACNTWRFYAWKERNLTSWQNNYENLDHDMGQATER
jgi:hypothetical protein